jgi:hypothetical protein
MLAPLLHLPPWRAVAETTIVDPVWEALSAEMHLGAALIDRYEQTLGGELGDWREDAASWVGHARGEIEVLTDPTEATLFAQAGLPFKWPNEILSAKVEYIRDRLLPKAGEGYWRRP